MELCRCTNFHVVCSKYLEVRGLPTCTCVAHAQCTTRPQVMYQRIALHKMFQCTKFRVASSKFPKSKGAYAYAYCTCIARARPKAACHEMTHTIELRSLISISVPNLVVDRSKFPRTVGPLANKLFRSWRAQPAPP